MTTEKPTGSSHDDDDDDVAHEPVSDEWEQGKEDGGKEKASRQTIRDRLYTTKKPVEKLKKSAPKLAENHYLLLKEHIRMMHGKSPRLIKRPRVICWMDSPDIEPKSNWTTEERDKRIRDRQKERKDSEEDAFSARCVN